MSTTWPGEVIDDTQPVQPSQQGMGRGSAPTTPTPMADAFPGEVLPEQVDQSTNLNAYAGIGNNVGDATLDPTGASEFARPEDMDFAAKAQQLFDSGGTRQQFDALSAQYGYPMYGEDLDLALTNRDTAGAGARIMAPLGGRTDPSIMAPIANSSTGAFLGSVADAGGAGLSDEIAGLAQGDSFGDVLAGTGEAQQRAQILKDASRAEYPLESTAGMLVGGITGTAGLGKLAGGARLATDTAYGTAYGAGENNEDRIAGGIYGGGASLGGSYFGGKLLDKIANRGPSKAAQAMDTAQGYGIDLPMGATGRGAAIIDNTLSNMPGSAQVLQNSRDALTDQVVGAVDNVAGDFGATTGFSGMGEAVQTGANKWMGKFDRVTSKVYDAITIPPKVKASLANTRAGLAEITRGFQSNPELSKIWATHPRLKATLDALTPTDTREAGRVRLTMEAEKLRGAQSRLDDAQANYQQIINDPSPANSLKSSSAEAAQRDLMDAQSQFETVKKAHDEAYIEANQPPMGGEVSWEDLKRLRSIVGEIAGDPGLAAEGNAKAALRKFYGALSEDMRQTASAVGPKQLREFERANTLYKQGQDRIDGALAKFLGDDGKKSAESAAAKLQSIAKEGRSSSDLKLLADIRKSMPGEEWGQVQNALIRLAGHPLNKSGRDFDPGVFARTFKDMDPAAKNLLFGKGDLRANLDEFTGVMESLGKVGALRNTSNTAGQLLTGLGFSSLGGIGGLALQAGTSYSLAKLWANPRFVKWATGYAKMARGTAQANGQPNVSKQLELLKKVAAAEPAIAQDALGLQQYLAQQFSQSPNKLAASENASDGGEKPPQ